MNSDTATQFTDNGERASGGDARTTAFTRSVLQIMENIEYRRCEAGEDLENIYRLRYNSYLSAGMVARNSSRIVEDDFDHTVNAYNYGVYYDGNLVSTVRMHHISAEYPEAPSVKVFGDVLEPRIAAGESFIDPSRFAADHEWSARLRVLPYITLRVPLIALRYFDVTASLTAIKEEHSSFYRRVFMSEPLVRGRQYPGLTCPVDLWQSLCPNVWQQAMARFPFFTSTPVEERMLFERPAQRQLGPLTILPTARYFLDAAA